ncbi:glycosyltransferase [Picrophilus oshimae]|uniref:Glycosyltransferase n=1 Tax=Picrophilus torridus (strain ATCC 700027 / DSM 9790 / JCM 10055 / NBRC 100828 / KAW 2/3) TaxID=1122961 RepID=Q6L2B2_PICTO|nr:glycosyltransferase family A protein [Picrophilus oshimae]AAT42890.1 glycosyltransferase [Picrophilus oshimae DSM 9789]
MEDLFISVIITAYNRKEFLLDAVKSALNQTLSKEKYEIIVIKNYNDDNIDEFLNKNNIKNIIMDGTIGEYLYKGINESKGDIISFLDDDDLFFNNKLEYVYNLFKKIII